MNEKQADKWAKENLARFFKDEKVNEVIRRKAPILGDIPAIDWIMEGRGEDLKALYERLLGYQVSA